MKTFGDYRIKLTPCGIIRTVQEGSFNQGNIASFGETASRQRACNALYALCWSIVRNICYLKSVDLEYILV